MGNLISQYSCMGDHSAGNYISFFSKTALWGNLLNLIQNTVAAILYQEELLLLLLLLVLQ